MQDSHSYTESIECDGLTVVDCQSCGFRHLMPLPSVEELRSLYTEEFGRSVRSGFSERKRQDADYWRLSFSRREDVYSNLLAVGPSRRILDVGCGTGGLLLHFKAAGWKVQGIEPNYQFAEDLRALDIPVYGSLTDSMTGSDWQAFVRSPSAVVSSAVAALKPGGILTIESPNDFNRLQLAAAEQQSLDKWWVNYLHLNYFDFDSLERLVQRCGLTPVRRDCQFPLEMFLLMGDIYVGNADLGRVVHRKRVAFEQALEAAGQRGLLAELYSAFSSLGLGRTAIVHAIRSK